MKFDKEIKREDSIAPNPVENGWYVCSVRTSSVTAYDETVSIYEHQITEIPIKHLIAEYEPRLLYWETNVWITHPRSYRTVDEKDIINWTKIPENYHQTVKIKN